MDYTMKLIVVVFSVILCVNADNQVEKTSFFAKQNPITQPRSCFDVLKDGVQFSGYYVIYTPDRRRHMVYCDFTSESGAAWTLVMSHNMKNKEMKQFATSLVFNLPVNIGSPNWNAYRMDLATMNHLKVQSTHWRYTCDYPKTGLDFDDYARAKFSAANPLSFNHEGRCIAMEYISVRGHACGNCGAKWFQRSNKDKRIFHAESAKKCRLDARKGAVKMEDNFGYYVHANPNFRCSANELSTTNLWFGQFL